MRHDHRKSTLLIAGGAIIWCYQCGASRVNRAGREYKWHKPSGLDGKNPAMKEVWK